MQQYNKSTEYMYRNVNAETQDECSMM